MAAASSSPRSPADRGSTGASAAAAGSRRRRGLRPLRRRRPGDEVPELGEVGGGLARGGVHHGDIVLRGRRAAQAAEARGGRFDAQEVLDLAQLLQLLVEIDAEGLGLLLHDLGDDAEALAQVVLEEGGPLRGLRPQGLEPVLDLVDALDLVHGGLGQAFDLGLELEDLLAAVAGLVEQAGPLLLEIADDDAVVVEGGLLLVELALDLLLALAGRFLFPVDALDEIRIDVAEFLLEDALELVFDFPDDLRGIPEDVRVVFHVRSLNLSATIMMTRSLQCQG